MLKQIRRLSALLIILFFPIITSADWLLDNDDSFLSFMSIKQENVAEVHHFTRLEGKVTNTGKATLTVYLASVDTMVAIRDERMRDILFDIQKYPLTSFTTQINMDQAVKMKPGETKLESVAGTLNFHGKERPLTAELWVTKLNNNRIQVSTHQPIIINTSDFELNEGVEKLRQLAGLSQISLAVPVNFILTYVNLDQK